MLVMVALAGVKSVSSLVTDATLVKLPRKAEGIVTVTVKDLKPPAKIVVKFVVIRPVGVTSGGSVSFTTTLVKALGFWFATVIR